MDTSGNAPRQPECSTCAFFIKREVHGQQKTFCHRHAPQVSHFVLDTPVRNPLDGTTGIQRAIGEAAGWPEVLPDMFCGEYQQAPKENVSQAFEDISAGKGPFKPAVGTS